MVRCFECHLAIIAEGACWGSRVKSLSSKDFARTDLANPCRQEATCCYNDTMNFYRSKYNKLPGSSYDEVAPLARKEYQRIKKLTKRQPYLRSAYFAKQKIFLPLFWEHLAQKHRGDRVSRLRLYICALDLLRHTPHSPDTIFSADNLNILLHRFLGQTKEGELFYVQVKEDKRTSRKDFMSVFPKGKRK